MLKQQAMWQNSFKAHATQYNVQQHIVVCNMALVRPLAECARYFAGPTEAYFRCSGRKL